MVIDPMTCAQEDRPLPLRLPELLSSSVTSVRRSHSRSVVHTETVRTGGAALHRTGDLTFTEVPEGTEVCVTAQVASFVGGHARGDATGRIALEQLDGFLRG